MGCQGGGSHLFSRIKLDFVFSCMPLALFHNYYHVFRLNLKNNHDNNYAMEGVWYRTRRVVLQRNKERNPAFKLESHLFICFTWDFSKSVGFTCMSYWCPRKSMLVCARPHKFIKVHLFIFAPYKVTNSMVGLLVVFTTSLVTVMSNTKEELFIDINYLTPILSKKNYSNPIKRTKEPPYPCTTHGRGHTKLFIFCIFVPK
jgi:hypothetical protein